MTKRQVLADLRESLTDGLHDVDFEIRFSPYLEALIEIAETVQWVVAGYDLSRNTQSALSALEDALDGLEEST